MGICCSKAAAGELDDDEDSGLGFPWMHDDLLDHHLWTSAGVSMHTKQGWNGANQDARTQSMTVCQVHHLTFSPWKDWLQRLCLLACTKFEQSARDLSTIAAMN